MKKVLSILLMLFYIIPAIGVSLDMHYCGGELASVSHVLAPAKSCKCGPIAMKKSCCENKQQTFKLDNSQQKASITTPNFNIPLYFVATTTAIDYIPASYKNAEPKNSLVYNPPENYKRAIYLTNCVFLI